MALFDGTIIIHMTTSMSPRLNILCLMFVGERERERERERYLCLEKEREIEIY